MPATPLRAAAIRSREEIQEHKFPDRVMAGINGKAPAVQQASKQVQPPPKQVQPSVVAAMAAMKAEAAALVAGPAVADPFADDSDKVLL